jgi:DNA-binding transcriptional regulator YiaG
MTQKELSVELGVEENTVTRWEADRNIPGSFELILTHLKNLLKERGEK